MRLAGRGGLLGIFLVGILLSSPVQAKRAGPKDVPPVTVGGVQYRVPHFGVFHGKPQNGGHVQAWDLKSNQMLWDRVVYRIRYEPKLETDVQDVFITEIQVRGEHLFVKNERSEEFEMDLWSGRVRALSPLGPNTLLPADAERSAGPPTPTAPVNRTECQDPESDAYFFPKGWLGVRRERFDEDQFVRAWYSKHLRAMTEPSLSCGDGTGDAFRFLWLRTWGRPIAVRLHPSGGGASMAAVELDGSGGYGPGKVSRRAERKLTDAEWTKIANDVRALNFWELPAQTNDNGLDGARWILEGRERSQYHVVQRWSPKEGPYRELCISLLKLVGWLPTGNGKRDAIY